MSSRIGRSGPDFRARATVAPGRLRRVWRAAQALGISALMILMALAVRLPLGGAWRAAMPGGLACVTPGFAGLWLKSMDRALWIGVAVRLPGAGAWYGSIRPASDGDRAPDVAHGVTATIDTDAVTLHNLRDFHGTSETDFSPPWEDRTCRLSDLRTMDLISPVGASPSIAHTLVSFGFADGRHAVFSAEIRRSRDQACSSLGGFFRKFDLVLIAADGRDIVRLRTDVRGEWVSLFPPDIPPGQMRDAFLSFVALGNDLAEHPRLCNTLATNCTTVVWRLARSIASGLPLDWRALASGHLPDDLHGPGVWPPTCRLTRFRHGPAATRLGRRAMTARPFRRGFAPRPPLGGASNPRLRPWHWRCPVAPCRALGPVWC